MNYNVFFVIIQIALLFAISCSSQEDDLASADVTIDVLSSNLIKVNGESTAIVEQKLNDLGVGGESTNFMIEVADDVEMGTLNNPGGASQVWNS